ncbi:hypothetical protein C8J57DRAFT_222735 [Mycena rebaudengoi]|nr:hypothetical protein C8J57DRAFT_222735 [Mycena rebaudengoi]
MPTLPQELLDTILAHLRDDYASLSACSLVSTSFVVPAQCRIFRSLWLHARSHPTFHDAATSLAQFPHLRSYIRDLTITLGSSDVEFDHSAVESILCAVKNVERLMFSARSTIYWNRLSYGLRSAIQTVVLLPSLRELHLATCFIAVPSQLILRAASSVSFLSVQQITLEEREETEFPVPDAATAQLKHLAILKFGWHKIAFCDLLLNSPTHISRIEQLTIRLDSVTSSECDSRILTAVAPNLTNLSIDVGGLGLSDPLDFPHMPLVRTFEITAYIDSGRRLPTKYPSTFAEIAAAFPGIEVLTLTFSFYPEHPEIRWWAEGTFPIMGASFSTRTQLVHLRQVHCKLSAQSRRLDVDTTIIRHFRDAMEQWMPGVPTHMMTFSLGVNPLFLERLPVD